MKLNNEWKDYEIIATGDGEKLERWGDVVLCLRRGTTPYSPAGVSVPGCA